jgi:cytochrome b subunit of formate dehydrogenase
MAINGSGQELQAIPEIPETIELVLEKNRQIKRFEVQQILQHATLMVSFTLLVITGIPMKFNEWASSEWWVSLWGGISTVRNVHHVAAFVMVALCFYHLGYIFSSTIIGKKPFPTAMIPSYKDFVNLYHEILYFFRLREEPPQFGRFNWREKFDYWAIFWGIPVMAGSGFILLFPVFATRFLPGWVVPVALVAHSHEALLALGWIFVVHVFFNHFSPGVFPLNKSIFTGRVPEERYKREHPLEWEKIKDNLPE